MSAMSSQITGLPIDYSTVYSGVDEIKYHWLFCGEFTGNRQIDQYAFPPFHSRVV